jgi:hypothetical protein
VNDSDGFGAELAQITGQFLALAQLAARSGGFRNKAAIRALLPSMDILATVTRRLIEGPNTTQRDVDLLTDCYSQLMKRVFSEIKINGDARQ